MQLAGYEGLTLAALVPALVYACWNDYRFRLIPNWLTAAVAVTGLAAQTLWLGLPGLQCSALGILVGFSVLILFWLVRAMGAGDVKLMAAVGAWVGPQLILFAILTGVLVGGVLALGIIVYQRRWSQTTANVGVMLTKMSSLRMAFSDYGSAKSLSRASGGMPYAIPLAIGTLITLFSGDFQWWGML